MSQSVHIKAIDWALSQGYVMSVTDLCCDEDEWDVEFSSDRAELIDACQATDIPNVYIFRDVGIPTPDDKMCQRYQYLLTFSVIDEGNPDETINDWTIPNDDADQWRIDAEKAFSQVVFA